MPGCAELYVILSSLPDGKGSIRRTRLARRTYSGSGERWAQLLRLGRGGAEGAWLPLPSLIEINYSIREFRRREQTASGLMRDPGGLDVASSGEGARVLVERRDQRAPRKGRKWF